MANLFMLAAAIVVAIVAGRLLVQKAGDNCTP